MENEQLTNRCIRRFRDIFVQSV